MMSHVTADQLEAMYPGLLDKLQARGIEISNNVGALIVEGYLGDILDAIEEVTYG